MAATAMGTLREHLQTCTFDAENDDDDDDEDDDAESCGVDDDDGGGGLRCGSR